MITSLLDAEASDQLRRSSAARLIHLDMLRGLAALAVVVTHVRGFVFVDYGDIASPGLADKTFYLLFGLGHQAVIAFFALSGFLVGSQALRRILRGAWSFPEYLAARLARLWTVLIPALVLTLFLDLAGRSIGGAAGYEGAWNEILSSGPAPAYPADHSPATLLANILFLQTIIAPVFGSNGPLWSLANEFWYYVTFPLIAAALLMRWSAPARAAAGLAAVLIAWLLPTGLMLLGAIWVAGALASHVTSLARARYVIAHPLFLAGAVMGVAVATILSRRQGDASTDLLLGAAWAALLPSLALLPPLAGLYARVAEGLSDISYTLYATHFPLLAFVWFSFIAPRQWPPNSMSLALAVALVALSLAAAVVTWWCFERNTRRVRRIAMRLLQRERAQGRARMHYDAPGSGDES